MTAMPPAKSRPAPKGERASPGQVSGARAWSAVADGIVLDVRLTPRGGADALDGIEQRGDGRVVIKARVRAAPVEGEANDALCRLIARSLAVAPSRVEVASGLSARIKRLRITGETAALGAAVDRLSTPARRQRPA